MNIDRIIGKILNQQSPPQEAKIELSENQLSELFKKHSPLSRPPLTLDSLKYSVDQVRILIRDLDTLEAVKRLEQFAGGAIGIELLLEIAGIIYPEKNINKDPKKEPDKS